MLLCAVSVGKVHLNLFTFCWGLEVPEINNEHCQFIRLKNVKFKVSQSQALNTLDERMVSRLIVFIYIPMPINDVFSLQSIFSSCSFYKIILILLQCSLLCKTDSKNLVSLTQRSKLNKFVLLCKGKKHLSLKVRSCLFSL